MGATLGLSRTQPLRVPGAASLAWPIGALALMACAHLYLATFRAVNWDEFFHFSQVHIFANGGWLQPLQTLHARVFAWALDFPGGPIEQIRAIRWVVFLFVLGTVGAIYLLTRRFANRAVALTCALLYLSAGFVLQHATSFRADAMIAALLMASLAILARAPLRPLTLLAIAALPALAAVESIKVVLYAPAFAGIAWLRWSESGFDRRTLLRLAAIPLLAAVLFGLLYLGHAHGLGGGAGATDGAAAQVVRNSGAKMFALGGLPYYVFILKAALLALVFAVLVLCTPWVLAREDSRPRDERIALAGLWLPITVVSFYHNTAPYFYVFILPPVAVACAPAAARLIERYSLRAVCCLAAVSGLALLAIEDRRAQGNQAQIIAAADAIFDEPVAYFDFPAMLGAWPKANHFMTPWGQDGYLARQMPSFRALMERQPVPLVIENSPAFEQLFGTTGSVPDFLPEDADTLRENYVRYWGPLHVAGRIANGGAGQQTSAFLVPGPYTVLDAPMVVDGRSLSVGSVVQLARGVHTIGAAGPKDARLIWGDRPGVPADPAPATPFWADF